MPPISSGSKKQYAARWRNIDKNECATKRRRNNLELSNKGTDAFWNKAGGIIIVECKNLSATVNRKEFDAFYAKMKRRGNLCELGFFVSYSGFSEGFRLAQSAARDKIVAMIDKDGLRRLVESNNRNESLEEIIRNSTH